ncbi:MAG: response regulator [Pseudomonadota bacterium]
MTLLLVDDNQVYCTRLQNAFVLRGWKVRCAFSCAQAHEVMESWVPEYAILDLKLGDGSGIDLAQAVLRGNANAKIIILTGYGNIATAVAAVKAGAIDYLPKPATPEQLIAALLEQKSTATESDLAPMSAERARWEYIQRVYKDCNYNVSQTAKSLQMHRRSLQRILAKHAPGT